MKSQNLACIVLAAGKGTRMKSGRPKVLHEVAGRSMLGHVLDSLEVLEPARIVVVVGPDMESLAEAARPHSCVVQEQQLGTGHAVLAARGALEAGGASDSLLVVFGDTPLITAGTLKRLVAARAALAGGATLVDPAAVWFSHDTELAPGVVVEPNVVFAPGVTVGPGARIRAFSHLEGATVAEGAEVGPYARLRPGAELGAGAKVGNFVEVKNAKLGEGAKANHLSYLGDAEVGAAANVGAGTITCNYDGFTKSRTEIGAGAFIGSNSALVAPIKVGAGAVVGAGSTITTDVPEDAVAVARSEQRNREGAAKRYRALKQKGKKRETGKAGKETTSKDG